ncbi:MAG: RNA polymerase sigma factor [Verrucomicrobiales bacterium]
MESNPEEEADWLQAIANGDRLSFRLLHQRFEAILFATIYQVLNHREDSEDVLQEVFAQIWSKAHQYDAGKGKALTWSNTMARNRAIDRYRSKQRRALLRDRYEGHVAVTGKPSSDQTEKEIRLKETRQVLSSAIYELTPQQREAIELAYFGDMTQRQVAEKVGQEVGTIKARIRRGIQRLGKTVPSKL